MERKSFIFNLDWAEVLSDYPPEVRLEVYDAIIRYAQSGTLSQLKPVANMAFSFIKRELDRNSERYDEVCEKRREAGRLGGAPKGNDNAKKQPKQAKQPNACENNQKQPKQAKQPDNDNDDDNDIIKEISSCDDDTKKSSSSSTSSPVIHKGLLKSFGEVVAVLKGDMAWREAVAMTNGIDAAEIDGMLGEFELHCQASGEEHFTVASARKHFNGWVKKRLKENKNESKRQVDISRRRGVEPLDTCRKGFKGAF